MNYTELEHHLASNQYTFLVTGCAGFIGSNLVETLLRLNQKVVGLDNFSTGYQKNIDEALCSVLKTQVENFTFYEGDIRSIDDCRQAVKGVDFVLHQAALGSVPRSIDKPEDTHASNVDGFLNMLIAARDANVKRFVYASTSAIYGDSPALPKVENQIGEALSPYAVSKHTNELYADVFAKCYGTECIGLRYFNVFGQRQDPLGAYAAVIPIWASCLSKGEPININGDGETSRDFCYIKNVVQANLLAATTDNKNAVNQVYNIAVNERTTLTELAHLLAKALSVKPEIIYRDFRQGDVKHSLADISKAKQLLNYKPTYQIEEGVKEAVDWYLD